MKMIPLTKGAFALVDDDDFDYLTQWKWFLDSVGYAGRNIVIGSRRTTIRMHRVIMNCPEGLQVDHINGIRLDDQKSNLRLCTHSENICNQKLSTANTTGFKGVHYRPDRGKYCSEIIVNHVRRRLGYFKTPEEAYAKYVSASQELHGEFSRIA